MRYVLWLVLIQRFLQRANTPIIYNSYGWRHKLSNTLVFWGFNTGSTKKTFLPRNRSRKMISGWYSVYPAPNGVARLFRFDRNSGFAKIWWLYESTGFYWSKTSCPRTSLDDGQLLRAIVDTISGFWCIPMSKPVPNQMPDLICIYFNLLLDVLHIFLQGVAWFIPSTVWHLKRQSFKTKLFKRRSLASWTNHRIVSGRNSW